MFRATGTKHVASNPGHVVQPVFSPSPTGCNSSAQPASHGKAKPWPLPLAPILAQRRPPSPEPPWLRPKQKLYLRAPCEAAAARRQQSRQRSTPGPVVWQQAPACCMQPVEPCRLPPTQTPPGKRLSCIQRLLGWWGGGGGAAAAASPVPGRANLGLVEQHYKYLLLRDSVTQPRSRKGKRCPHASPRCLRSAARSLRRSAPIARFTAGAPGCRAEKRLAERRADGAGKRKAAFLPPAQRGGNVSPMNPPSSPPPAAFFPPLPPPFPLQAQHL